MTTTVRKHWPNYDPKLILDFNLKVQREMGWVNRRWGMTVYPTEQSWATDGFFVEYWFQDDHDATMFALKYLGS